MKRFLLRLVLFAVIFSGVFATFEYFTLPVSAASCPLHSSFAYDRAPYCGYFNNNYDDSGSFVLPSGITTFNRATFAAEMNNWRNGTAGTTMQTGAAFIIATMLGHNGGDDSVIGIAGVSGDATYAAWLALITQPGVTINMNYSLPFPCGIQNSFSQTGGHDDAFFTESSGSSSSNPCGPNARVASIVFIQNGSIKYAIKRNCGNPVGHFAGLTPPPTKWAISGKTTASVATVYPGDPVTFSSTITNDKEGGTADFVYGTRYFYSDTSTPLVPYYTNYTEVATSPNKPGSLKTGVTYGPNGNTIQTVTVAANGKYICGDIAFTPYNWTGAANGRSTAVCVLINNPVGACGVLNPGSPEPNQTFTVTGSVNYGSAADATNVYGNGGRVYMKIYGPSPSSTLVFNGAPGSASPQGVSGVQISGTFTVVGGLGAGKYWIEFGIAGPAGATSCGGMTIGSPPVPCPDPTASNCNPPPLTISNRPYLEVLGGDVVAGAGYGDSCTQDDTAGIDTSNKGPAGGYRGSATDLAVFSLTHINNFASGTVGETGAFSTNLGAAGQPNGLAFANTTPSPGSFGSLGCVPDYANDAASASGAKTDNTTTDINPGSLASGVYLYNAPGPIFIEPGVIPAGVSITLVTKSDVVIKGNVTYGAYPSISQAPRLNIISTGDLLISHNVTSLSGFYVAQGGAIATCGDDSNNESIDPTICSGPLTVNGALSAQTIRFDRTFGTMSSTGPAEKIIFSPELWGAGLVGCDSATQTCPNTYSSITSLPPVL